VRSLPIQGSGISCFNSSDWVMARIELILGDITKLNVDAIVNAANSRLLGGGGVDGAIHRAAGPELLNECRKLGGCPTGEARTTRGYHLPARHVIHTVGPIWRGGSHGEDELLASCYRNSLKLAELNAVKSIAFPSISTGAYQFPIQRASRIALRTVREYLRETSRIERVVFVCYSKDDYETYLNEFGGCSQEIV
jgi:O-acetyl-ADP-ribose deacetylase (regulator of RNase III)